ncbi:cwf18 pre-mRNA splicing factor domain-containing protein [Hirsutella rhossiliensis]|uniref:Cwf18 pre-mRNA splicing factor domain-containing protein n=1 Tax=Hirsutella rhossiliensis TaxID=111463 RepID=A0A9P8N0R8_9HYPO|nr:cwf18 pre-mRNA splicing factor domain-containing protein [Hirsutella rhossiliensis]KAH0963839.1 cwf18 pre-mRNA splicing factor domain-containing protein [Hirsutella rhossiliensis]
MSSSLNTLGAAAEDRKARLARLRGLKRKQPNDEVAAPESERSPSQPEEPDVTRLHLSGRNYDFETKGPKLGFEHMPNQGLDAPTLEEQAAEVDAQVQRQAADEAQDDKGIDLLKLQPKKPNWDLKRDLDKKMEILNVRTDNAIAKLVRDRITRAQKAAQKDGDPANALADGEAAGMDGLALVEGLRVREQAGKEEEEREREEAMA